MDGSVNGLKIKIINKIDEKVHEYQIKNNVTRTKVAQQLDMSSSRMYQLFKADNMTIDVLIKFAILLDCKLDDLIEYKQDND